MYIVFCCSVIYIYNIIYSCLCFSRARRHRVPMARHGFMFGQNEGYRLQETFKTPPGPSWFHFAPKTIRKHVKITKIWICVLRKLYFLCIGSH